MKASDVVGLLVGVAALVLTSSCGDLLRSKEDKQQIAEIKRQVTADPSSINVLNEGGEPLLHIAVSSRYRSLVAWLLERGADPAVRDRNGQTALHAAVFSDRRPGFPILKLLLRRGVPVDVAADDGSTPLHLAASSLRGETAEFLLDSGAQVNSRTRLHETPLHRAATPQPTATADQVREMVDLLVSRGAEIEARMSNGNTPLHLAALIGSPLAVEALLAAQADPDARGIGGQTALHVAATFGRAGVTHTLLAAGAEANALDDSGRTPLWRALHDPAVSGSPSGHVDTTEIAEVLERFGGVEQN